MRTVTNKLVAEAWVNGESAHNSRGNFKTDGIVLYSYQMLIGITVGGEKISLIGTKPYRVSVTTSAHCRHARSVACVSIAPGNSYLASMGRSYVQANDPRGMFRAYLFPDELLSAFRTEYGYSA